MNLNGFNDPYLRAKFRLYRKNTADWILGVAPHIGVNLPVGAVGIGSGTWDPDAGINLSFRPRFFSLDMAVKYQLMDITGGSAEPVQDQFSSNLAVSHTRPVNAEGTAAIAPVVEINYFRDVAAVSNQVDPWQLMMLSPGLSFIVPALTIEGLLQVPVFQEPGTGMRQNYRFMVGMKLRI